MGIDEYDAELHEKTLLEIGREQGIDIGIASAITNTISILKRNGFSDTKIASEISADFDMSSDEVMKYILES